MHDWEQRLSKDTLQSKDHSNSYQATGIAFFSGGSKIAFANGNTIEIRNIRQAEDDTVVLDLSDDMIASDIYISGDNNQLFAFMDYWYWDYNYYPALLHEKNALQAWNLNSGSIQSETVFPEPMNVDHAFWHPDEVRRSSGKFLTYINYVTGVFNVTDLETSKIKDLPFLGDFESFPSPDANFVVYFPYLSDQDGSNCNDGDVEIWDANTKQVIYKFKVPSEDFDSFWCYPPHSFLISPDNNLLAISHNEQVSLWDISR